MMIQVTEEADKSQIQLDESNNILKNFESEINNEDMPSDEEDVEESPELLAELEQKQEDYIEEFMGRTFDFKQEYMEEVKADCKKQGKSREETKQATAEAEKKVKDIRRKGTKALKQMFLEITEDEELTLPMKISYFTD